MPLKLSVPFKNGTSITFRQYIAVLSFLLIGISAEAKNYYFSSSSGNDSYTITQAQNQATPWKSISKLNSFSSGLVSGDVVLFKTDDVFYGTISSTASGVTYTSFGDGDKPIVTGLTTISSWTSLGNNIWEAVVPGGLSTLNVVVINGKLTPMGRYPNTNAENGGYLTYESSVLNVSLTDNQLTSSTNWTGGEVVFRRQDFTTDRAKIISHLGSTLAFTTYPGVALTPGYGYFIENHISTLNQNGEWFYDVASKKIKIYYTSTPPSIQVSTLKNLVNLVYQSGTVKSNITFRNISFQGCEGIMTYLSYCNNVTIDNCNLSYAGINAIEYRYVNNLTIQNSNIADINMVGLFENQSPLNNTLTIRNNTIRRIGVNAGMINNTYGEGVSSTGINVGTGNLLIEGNTIDSTGYIAIALRGNKNNQIIRKNVISNFCSVKNDGGAIYNAGLRGSAIATNVVIENNIIFKAIGAIAGTTTLYNKHTRAIYLDATSYGIQVLNNTVFDAWDGIYISQAQNMTIRGNTVYNTGNYNPTLKYFSAAMVINDAFDGFQHVRNNTITNNIFFAKYPDQLLFDQSDKYDSDESIGNVDSNYYANPASDMPLLITNTGATFSQTPYSIPLWKATFPRYDLHSKGSPKKIPAFVVNSLIGKNKFPNESFNGDINDITASSAARVHTLSWDNTNQITGAGSAELTSNVVSTNFTSLSGIIGSIDQNKDYVLRFKTKATKAGSFRAYIQQWTGAYSIITSTKIGSVGTGVEQHEILFSGEHSTQSVAALFIQFSQNNSTVYLDDVQFFEATTSPTNVDDYLRFEYNATNSAVTIPLSDNYMAVDGTLYHNGSITLQPYTSKILLKDTGSVTTPPATGERPQVSVAAAAVNCSGSASAVTVSATGGTAPYSGTGVYNTNAGRGSLRVSFPSSVATVSTGFSASVGAISVGKYYVLKFSTLGTTDNGHLTAHLRQYLTPFKQLTELQSNDFGRSRVDHTFFFTPDASNSNGMFMIDIFQNSGTTYIDNVAFFEADEDGKLIGNNLFTNGQFESNISGLNIWSSNGNEAAQWDNTAKISNINYYTVTDARGLKSTVGLTIRQPATPLSATVTLAGAGTVTVTATGGAEPYTGTGTFSVEDGLNNFAVKDANGCSDVASITISAPGGSSDLTPLVTAGPVNCSGTSTSVNVAASGGTAPYTGTGTFSTNAGKGTLRIAFLKSSGATTALSAPIGAISNNKNYVLKLTTLGTTPYGYLTAHIRQSGAPFTRLSSSQNNVFGTTRVDHTFFFTPYMSNGDGMFMIDISQYSGTTYIDNIGFFEADSIGGLISENLYTQGQFESGINGINVWSSNNNQEVAWDNSAKISNTNFYTVTDAKGFQSTMGLTIRQPAVPLNAVVTLNGLTSVTVSATGGAGPYTGTGVFSVLSGLNNFLVRDANGCTDIAGINISLGLRTASGNSLNSGGSALGVVDNSSSTTGALKVTGFPNPASTEFGLLVEGGTNEKIEISVIGADGRSIFKTSGGTNKTYKFGNSFMPGLYIIKVNQGNTLQILKMIKTNK